LHAASPTRSLHSSPTRRSSDLEGTGRGRDPGSDDPGAGSCRLPRGGIVDQGNRRAPTRQSVGSRDSSDSCPDDGDLHRIHSWRYSFRSGPWGQLTIPTTPSDCAHRVLLSTRPSVRRCDWRTQARPESLPWGTRMSVGTWKRWGDVVVEEHSAVVVEFDEEYW